MRHDKLHSVYSKLPVILQWNKVRVRCLEPLMDAGFQMLLEDMGSAAWGYLEGTGWQKHLPNGEPFNDLREIRISWLDQLLAAADQLAESGGCSGPTGDRELWLSWLFLSVGPASDLRKTWEELGGRPLPTGGETEPVYEKLDWENQPRKPPARFGAIREHSFKGFELDDSRGGPGCKLEKEVDGWAPGRVLYVRKRHRSDWGVCEYWVQCEEDGSYTLTRFKGNRTDLKEGVRWATVTQMFRSLTGPDNQTTGGRSRSRMTIRRFFRYGRARPVHIYRTLGGRSANSRKSNARYACTVDFAPDLPTAYRLLECNEAVATPAFLDFLEKMMTVPVRQVRGGGSSREPDGSVIDYTTITARKLGHREHYVDTCHPFWPCVTFPPSIVGYKHVEDA
jgi:hypothetical protein